MTREASLADEDPRAAKVAEREKALSEPSQKPLREELEHERPLA